MLALFQVPLCYFAADTIFDAIQSRLIRAMPLLQLKEQIIHLLLVDGGRMLIDKRLHHFALIVFARYLKMGAKDSLCFVNSMTVFFIFSFAVAG